MVRVSTFLALLLLGCVSAKAEKPGSPEETTKRLAPFFRPPVEWAKDLGKHRSPLLFDDGSVVRSAADWPKRRAEILKYWHDAMGPWPKLLDKPKVEYLKKEQRDGLTQHHIRIEVAPDKMTDDAYLLIPEGKGPFAAVVVVYYDAKTGIGLGKAELRDFAYQLARRGFVTLSLGSPPQSYYPNKKEAQLQPLSYHAYVAANCHSALSNLSNVDAKRIGIVGHSYGGKWAMFASCLYDKFACAVWSDGGIVFDEKRGNVNYWEPWYLGYESGKERKAGIPNETNPRTGTYRKLIEDGRDLHELHALMAPRPFLVSGGSEDYPERWKSLNHAIAVNKLLGYENRVAMTNRKGHSPTEESNAQLYDFFEHCLKHGNALGTSNPKRGYSIPLIDLAGEKDRQVLVDREAGQYLGHPSTLLLEDGKTILIVYPKGHGRGGIVMKRSDDGGRTWTQRLPTPKSWETSKETPTIYRTIDAKGKKRVILFSGMFPIRMSVSEDDGKSWSELQPIGDFGGIVAMASVERLKNGDYMALFHDDGRYLRENGKKTDPRRVWVYKTLSKDGGLTWSQPEIIATHPEAQLTEPGLIRSPDGKQIAVLLRESGRKFNSFVIFSDDEGKTWTKPRELPGALTGDRHVGRYAPDGRLFLSFRDTTHESSTRGDWVAWVGTYDDIVKGSEGQYRVRLMKNHKGYDCAYPGVELLPDGTFVTTTYGHWVKDEQPFIVSVRMTLKHLDERVKKSE